MNAEQAYLFRHALLRDAAYQLQLPAERGRLHALALSVLESLLGGRPVDPGFDAYNIDVAVAPAPIDEFARELVQHAAEVAESESSTDATSALLTYLRRAALHAEREFDWDGAVRHWRELARRTTGEQRAIALMRAANAATDARFEPLAEDLMLESMAHAVPQDSPLFVAQLGNLATCKTQKGQLEEALALYTRIFESRQGEQNALTRARALSGRALVHQRMGHVHEAGTDFDEALRLIGDDPRHETHLAGLLAKLAFHLHRIGKIDQARAHYGRALDLYGVRGLVMAGHEVQINLGVLELEGGRFDHARTVFTRLLDEVRRTGPRFRELICLANLAIIEHIKGRHASAAEFAQQAIAGSQEFGFTHLEGHCRGVMAETLLALNDVRSATAQAQLALEQCRKIHYAEGEAYALNSLALCVAAVGKTDEAVQWHEAAIAVAQKAGLKLLCGKFLCGLAATLAATGRQTLADEKWSIGAALLREVNAHAMLAMLREKLEVAARPKTPSGEA